MTSPGSADPRLLPALGGAAVRVAGEWGGTLRVDAASVEEVRRHAAVIEEAVRSRVEGRPTPPTPPATHLTRRLLQRIHTTLIEDLGRLTPPADGAALLQLLGAFDAVARSMEPNWDQHFTDRLSGPDGLELVVEVAHDLRSPLTSILFLAETLQRGRSGPVTPLQERQLGLIYSAAFGLSSVASDVIELARGGDRLVDMEPLPFSVSDILVSVRDIVQPIAEEKGLDVRLVAPEGTIRIGHSVALSRVLLNLTTNALKFSDEGFVEVSASVGEGAAMEFAVRDTGRGIPQEAMEMLFEPFRRRQKERDYAFSGSGLGLSICRKLVEAMGSQMQVRTAPGEGTRFFFTLDLPHVGHS
ncbi:MAG: sensor histidine kinase [Gemmatimonadales bacterium]